MTKYILASAAAFALSVAPIAVMAQTNADTATPGASQQMKGPPNANGMSKDNPSGDMKAGRSENSSGGESNGAAAAKATGADKQ